MSLWCCGGQSGAASARPGRPLTTASGLPHWLVHATRGRDFTLEGQTCLGKVVDVYDGDTVRLVFKPEPFSTHVQLVARMAGYDSPEMKQPTQESEHERARKRALAVAARDRLAGLVLHQIMSVRCGPFDKYGRVMVTLESPNRQGWQDRQDRRPAPTVNDIMVAEGHGKPYSGRTAKPRH
jgi:endonuclease YncB( thermonuclease family)